MTSDWMSQKPFVVTQEDLQVTWGLAGRDFACGFCMRPFVLGETVRWIAMPTAVCNTFVCAKCDGPDVKERFVTHWYKVIAPILRRWGNE
jgi:hypothetical protein